jgi:uncharacterized protein YjbJ (UPF0337 family)
MGEIIDKVKGKIEQITGTLTGNDKLQGRGEVDEHNAHDKRTA